MKKDFNRRLLSLFTVFLCINAYQAQATSQTAVCVTNELAPKSVFLENYDIKGGVIIKWQVFNNAFMTNLARGPMSGIVSASLDKDGKLDSFHGVYQREVEKVVYYIVNQTPQKRWQITYISQPPGSTAPTPLQIANSKSSYPLFCRLDYSGEDAIYSPKDASINDYTSLLNDQFSKPDNKEIFQFDKKAYYPVSNATVNSSSSSSGGGSSSSGSGSSSSGSGSSSSGSGSSSSGSSSSSSSIRPLIKLSFCYFKDYNEKTRYMAWLEKLDPPAFIGGGSLSEVIKNISTLSPYKVVLNDSEYQEIHTLKEIEVNSGLQTAGLNLLALPDSIKNLKEINNAKKIFLSVETTTNTSNKVLSKKAALCYTSSVLIDDIDTLTSLKIMGSLIKPNEQFDNSSNISSQLDKLEKTSLYYCAFRGNSNIRYVSWAIPPNPFAVMPFNTLSVSLKKAIPTITLDDGRLPGQYTTLTLTQQNINDSEEINKLTTNLTMPGLLDLKSANKEVWYVNGKYKGNTIENKPALCYKLSNIGRTPEEVTIFAQVVANSVRDSWPTDPSIKQSTPTSSSNQAEDYAMCVSKAKSTTEKAKSATEVLASWKLNLNEPKDYLKIDIIFNSKPIVSSSKNNIVINYTDVGGYVSKIYNTIGNRWILSKDNENLDDKAWTLAVRDDNRNWSTEALSCTVVNRTIQWKDKTVRKLAVYRFDNKYIHFNYCSPETLGNVGYCIAQDQNPVLSPDDDGKHESKRE